jgi:hypothetical protein
MSLRTLHKMLVALSFFASTSLFAAPLVIDVAGIQSNNRIGSAENTVLLFDVGANSTIDSVSYAVNLTAYGRSFLSEMRLSFTDSAQSVGVFLTPGVGDIAPGTGSYADAANLIDLNLDFAVGSDGILRLEFFESFNDVPGADGQWNFGTITFGVNEAAQAVPEPASTLLLGAGLALIGYTRRRRSA